MNTSAVVLQVVGQGNVPAFKNSKMIARGKLLTKPKYKEWMERCIQSFVSELNCAMMTSEGETLTVQQVRSWIASCVPEDDCWQCIPEISIKAVKGNAGATITIEALQ